MLVTRTRKEAVETIETANAGKNNKKSEGGKYPENFILLSPESLCSY